MEKIEKKASRNKKKQPLKVVYITNPMKFKTSASEFRALVQELTGQDADTAYSASTGFSAEDGGGEAVKVAEEDNVHAELEEEVTKLGRPSGGVSEPDPFSVDGSTSLDEGFVSSLMVENFQGMDSNLVDHFLKSLDAM